MKVNEEYPIYFNEKKVCLREGDECFDLLSSLTQKNNYYESIGVNDNNFTDMAMFKYANHLFILTKMKDEIGPFLIGYIYQNYFGKGVQKQIQVISSESLDPLQQFGQHINYIQLPGCKIYLYGNEEGDIVMYQDDQDKSQFNFKNISIIFNDFAYYAYYQKLEKDFDEFFKVNNDLYVIGIYKGHVTASKVYMLVGKKKQQEDTKNDFALGITQEQQQLYILDEKNEVIYGDEFNKEQREYDVFITDFENSLLFAIFTNRKTYAKFMFVIEQSKGSIVQESQYKISNYFSIAGSKQSNISKIKEQSNLFYVIDQEKVMDKQIDYQILDKELLNEVSILKKNPLKKEIYQVKMKDKALLLFQVDDSTDEIVFTNVLLLIDAFNQNYIYEYNIERNSVKTLKCNNTSLGTYILKEDKNKKALNIFTNEAALWVFDADTKEDIIYFGPDSQNNGFIIMDKQGNIMKEQEFNKQNEKYNVHSFKQLSYQLITVMNEKTLNKYSFLIKNNSGEYDVVMLYSKYNQKVEIESQILNQDVVKNLSKEPIHRKEINIVCMKNTQLFINLTETTLAFYMSINGQGKYVNAILDGKSTYRFSDISNSQSEDIKAANGDLYQIQQYQDHIELIRMKPTIVFEDTNKKYKALSIVEPEGMEMDQVLFGGNEVNLLFSDSIQYDNDHYLFKQYQGYQILVLYQNYSVDKLIIFKTAQKGKEQKIIMHVYRPKYSKDVYKIQQKETPQYIEIVNHDIEEQTEYHLKEGDINAVEISFKLVDPSLLCYYQYKYVQKPDRKFKKQEVLSLRWFNAYGGGCKDELKFNSFDFDHTSQKTQDGAIKKISFYYSKKKDEICFLVFENENQDKFKNKNNNFKIFLEYGFPPENYPIKKNVLTEYEKKYVFELFENIAIPRIQKLIKPKFSLNKLEISEFIYYNYYQYTLKDHENNDKYIDINYFDGKTVNADIFFYIMFENQITTSTLAYANSYDVGSQILPHYGMITINKGVLQIDPTGSLLNMDENAQTVIHEVFHALGFNRNKFILFDQIHIGKQDYGIQNNFNSTFRFYKNTVQAEFQDYIDRIDEFEEREGRMKLLVDQVSMIDKLYDHSHEKSSYENDMYGQQKIKETAMEKVKQDVINKMVIEEKMNDIINYKLVIYNFFKEMRIPQNTFRDFSKSDDQVVGIFTEEIKNRIEKMDLVCEDDFDQKKLQLSIIDNCEKQLKCINFKSFVNYLQVTDQPTINQIYFLQLIKFILDINEDMKKNQENIYKQIEEIQKKEDFHYTPMKQKEIDFCQLLVSVKKSQQKDIYSMLIDKIVHTAFLYFEKQDEENQKNNVKITDDYILKYMDQQYENMYKLYASAVSVYHPKYLFRQILHSTPPINKQEINNYIVTILQKTDKKLRYEFIANQIKFLKGEINARVSEVMKTAFGNIYSGFSKFVSKEQYNLLNNLNDKFSFYNDSYKLENKFSDSFETYATYINEIQRKNSAKTQFLENQLLRLIQIHFQNQLFKMAEKEKSMQRTNTQRSGTISLKESIKKEYIKYLELQAKLDVLLYINRKNIRSYDYNGYNCASGQNLKQQIKEHFGKDTTQLCLSMEDQIDYGLLGGEDDIYKCSDGSIANHWAFAIFGDENMVPTSTNFNQISKFTLAIFVDYGSYIINLNRTLNEQYISLFFWGRNEGQSFFDNYDERNQKLREICNNDQINLTCGADPRVKAQCEFVHQSRNNRLIVNHDEYVCIQKLDEEIKYENSKLKNPYRETFGIDSRCFNTFENILSFQFTTKGGYQYDRLTRFGSVCHKTYITDDNKLAIVYKDDEGRNREIRCDKDNEGEEYQIEFKKDKHYNVSVRNILRPYENSYSIQCPKDISFYFETLKCQKYNHCNSNGICMSNGQCECFKGYYGKDCSKKCTKYQVCHSYLDMINVQHQINPQNLKVVGEVEI